MFTNDFIEVVIDISKQALAYYVLDYYQIVDTYPLYKTTAIEIIEISKINLLSPMSRIFGMFSSVKSPLATPLVDKLVPYSYVP